MSDGLLNELVGAVDELQRLLEVNDVNAVALGEDETLHLRVPPTSLMPEVNAALEQLAHGDDRGHAGVPFLSCARPQAPARSVCPGARTTSPRVSSRTGEVRSAGERWRIPERHADTR